MAAGSGNLVVRSLFIPLTWAQGGWYSWLSPWLTPANERWDALDLGIGNQVLWNKELSPPGACPHLGGHQTLPKPGGFEGGFDAGQPNSQIFSQLKEAANPMAGEHHLPPLLSSQVLHSNERNACPCCR